MLIQQLTPAFFRGADSPLGQPCFSGRPDRDHFSNTDCRSERRRSFTLVSFGAAAQTDSLTVGFLPRPVVFHPVRWMARGRHRIAAQRPQRIRLLRQCPMRARAAKAARPDEDDNCLGARFQSFRLLPNAQQQSDQQEQL